MTVPKILLVITHEEADQSFDGQTTKGAVRDVYSNLPARYLDVVIREYTVTERDSSGAVIGTICDPRHPRGEAPFKIPIDPPSQYPVEIEMNDERDDGIEEWDVMFWHADDLHKALVLKASSVSAAAQRVEQEFPGCRIVSIEEKWVDEEHPMSYLDQFEIILPVGGLRIPKVAEQTQ